MSDVAQEKNHSGWHYSPNSLANLEKRVLLQHQRKCTRCGRVARRNSPYCLGHGGPSGRSAAFGRFERSILGKMERAGLLPGDLLVTPVWQSLNGLPTAIRSPLRLRLVMLWPARESEPLAFAQVWREALAAGKREGDKRKTTGRPSRWMANL